MNEKLKIGIYVRTTWGTIGKVWFISQNATETCDFDLDCGGKTYLDSEIHNLSSNINDLIEDGDYINGMLVYKCEVGLVINQIDGSYITLEEFLKYNKLNNIMTKEQYELNCYKIGE